MKKILPALLTLVCFAANFAATAQCSGGQTRCALNWDYLSFFPSSGISPYTTLAHSQTQNFAFGTQKATITHNFASGLAVGENATNTAETGAFGLGEDVNFNGDGTITVTFQTGVDSIRFSIFDIDGSQRMTVTSTGAEITMTRISGSLHTITGSGTSSANAKATTTTVVNSDVAGTINVLITRASPITSFTLAMTETASSANFWLSDISACSGGLFTNNYFQVSKPFTGQPGYVVASRQDTFYFVDPTTGNAKFLFRDPGHLYMNSVAYDPVKHYVYYCHSLTGTAYTVNGNNRSLRRYNYDMDTMGIVMSDINAIVPAFEQGIESGAAAFYDGCLYLGLEATATGSNKSIVWRVEFNASDVPVSATQVFAIDGPNHDWGDIGVANGVLYDFDARTGVENYYHSDLYSKAVTVYSPTGTNTPRQTAVDWNNQVYSVGGPTTASPGTITPYNGNGTLNTAAQRTITDGVSTNLGSWGDAGEAFKPRVDYGDAPATYDPGPGDPAVHELASNLYLGFNRDNEWSSRGQTTFANSDNFDDGMILGSLVNPANGTFFAQVRYMNNTGATATICAWVDFNNNGRFDASEGLSQTNLPSSASTQNAFFNWTGVVTTLTDGSYTYIRLRITTTANGMTTANSTGYYNVGEVEDYRIVVTTNPLATQLVTFNAVKNKEGKVAIDWAVANEEAGLLYTLERSDDAANWQAIYTLGATANKASNNYAYLDSKPIKATAYYRLKLTKASSIYSTVRKISAAANHNVQLVPNPSPGSASLVISTDNKALSQITIYDVSGRRLQSQSSALNPGTNVVVLPVSGLPNGIYWVQTAVDGERYNQRLLIQK